MTLKLKFFPAVALALCWTVVSNEAHSGSCADAHAKCGQWYADGGKAKNEDGCTGYKGLCQKDQGKYAKAFVACMTGSAGNGDCNTIFSAQKGPACEVAKNACKD